MVSHYVRPSDLESAIAVLKQGAMVRLVAGGTDLSLLLRDRALDAEVLLDISDLPELRACRETDDGDLIIGAAMTLVDLAKDNRIPAVLRSACEQIGTPQVRNLATIGGNVCNASPAGDTITPLLALDAVARVTSVRGDRDVSLNEFLTGPKRTVLAADEILVSLGIPGSARRRVGSFRKIGRRREVVISQVNVAVTIALNDAGDIAETRIALGSVAPTPVRAVGAEKLLQGRRPDAALVRAAAAVAAAGIEPITDVRAPASYRKRVTEVLCRRCLVEAFHLGGVEGLE